MIFAISLTGPTASGKTALSLGLAKELGCEIISSDSMQIYKRMDIGTAKATKDERAIVPHHLIDFLEPDVKYSAEDYRLDAMRAAEDITKRGKIPLFVGGTGLYIDTVIRGASQTSPPSDKALTAELLALGESEEGREQLWQRLNEIDPESAEKIHKNNLRRVVRALEIYELSGTTKSEFDRLSRERESDITVGMITLDFHCRDNLYDRVNRRVDMMLDEGLVREVESLWRDGMLRPEYTSAQAIGYKEIVDYLEGRMSLDEAVSNLKLSSRRYAKRQLTWFRSSEAKRIYVDTEDGVMKNKDELLSEVLSAAREFIKEWA